MSAPASSSSSSSSSSAAPKASFANAAALGAEKAGAPSASTGSSGILSAQQEQEESQRIVQHYKGLRAQISETANKINELDSDRNEHELVLRALTGLEPSRRCYRSIGGVLVERTIAEVQPAVQKNLKGIEDVVTKLSADLKQLEKDADEFRIKYNIQMGDAAAEKAQQQQQQQQQGGQAGAGSERGQSLLA